MASAHTNCSNGCGLMPDTQLQTCDTTALWKVQPKPVTTLREPSTRKGKERKGTHSSPYSLPKCMSLFQSRLSQTLTENLLCAKSCVWKRWPCHVGTRISWRHRGAKRTWHAGALTVFIGQPNEEYRASLQGKGGSGVSARSPCRCESLGGRRRLEQEVYLSSTLCFTGTMKVLGIWRKQTCKLLSSFP